MFPWLGPPCLLLSFLIISTMPALLLAAACEPERCGNLSVSAPFGVVSGSEENGCAQAQLGFQVHCTDGVPYLGYYEPEYGLQILDIFYNNGSLLVSDVHKIGGFNLSNKKGYRVPTANTATKVGPPFSLSPLNQNLVFYNCTKVPAGQAGLVETVCRNNTFVRARGRYNWTGGINSGYTLEGCSATAVPVLGASQEVNARDYKALISDGFLLTWQSPSGGSGKLAHPRHSSNTSRQQLGVG
ncbi:unnamed protein product [Triticum turgidum subsp. durum]|uniref:Wall-associated receptor kinase galacturonan-binding domain-containing protein n=1 Tax=Triticum turgidum subsp. durum TaxID=4567 RepID=A0A9R0VE05_TRITD|nr:unnamed protein product [Triticum turgidum subsp. durum]